MEIDSMSIADNLENQDCDQDIHDLACYRGSDPFLPQLIAGRAMTTELTQYLNDFSLPNEDSAVSVSTFTETSQDLHEWRVGGPPENSYDWYRNNHPTTQGIQMNPVRDSPWSPPLEEQRPTNDFNDQQYRNNNAGTCGLKNETFHSGCVVSGKSFDVIKDEITLGYLEQTQIAEELTNNAIHDKTPCQLV